MDKIFELNTVNNVKDSVGTSKVKATSQSLRCFLPCHRAIVLLLTVK